MIQRFYYSSIRKKKHGALKELNGMFAFAYWEEASATLYLARDRAGKKPLYYCEFNGIFSFSSEIKALLTLPWVSAVPDEESIYHFLTFNQLPSSMTMFKGIHKLSPGHCMTITKGKTQIEQYWEISPEDWTSSSEQEISDTIYRSLEKSVDYRMVADVPVGAFLSGGVDSSAIVALMSKTNSNPVKTYSVGFKDAPDYDEKSFAHRIADMYKTEHHEVNIDAGDIANSLPHIIDSFDEPMADATCIPIYFLSKLAREKGTIVVQTGDGADELFAGYRSWLQYNRYYPLYHIYSKTPSFLRKGIAGLINETKDEASAIREIFSRAAKNEELFWGGARAFKESTKRTFLSEQFNTSSSAFDSFSVIHQYRKEFDLLKRKHSWLKDLDWMCYLGFKFQIPAKYLYRMDRLGMANSIEIRCPFLDFHLINAAFSVPAGLKIKNNEPKYILKKSLERLLPNDILYRRKMGFCVPLREWAGDVMLDYMDEHLKSFARNTGIFDEKGLQHQIEQIRRGNTAFTNQLWTIYFMMAWFKKWMSA
ncbi:MAG: asparagine synthase (glutamine-hydrolyzing) [Bacteroidetes bacterium]|nr:asparagine synthase (glutamine-hydrolyzing) [Bacteroidota bacterium]